MSAACPSGLCGKSHSLFQAGRSRWLQWLLITRQKALEFDGTVSSIVLLGPLEKQQFVGKSQNPKLCLSLELVADLHCVATLHLYKFNLKSSKISQNLCCGMQLIMGRGRHSILGRMCYHKQSPVTCPGQVQSQACSKVTEDRFPCPAMC